MPEGQSAHPEIGAGLTCMLELIERMMRSLEERLAPSPPPPGLLARLCRLVSGQALADRARLAVCAMLRAQLAVLASSLSASVMADLPSPVVECDPAQDATALPTATAPGAAGTPDTGAAPSPGVRGDEGAASITTDVTRGTANGASMAVAPAALATTDAPACDTPDGGAAVLPSTGAVTGAPVTEARDADQSASRKPKVDAPGLDGETASPGAATTATRAPSFVIAWLNTGVSRGAPTLGQSRERGRLVGRRRADARRACAPSNGDVALRVAGSLPYQKRWWAVGGGDCPHRGVRETRGIRGRAAWLADGTVSARDGHPCLHA